MRQGWRREHQPLALDAAAVAELIAEAVPGATICGFDPVVGGISNTNLRVDLAGGRGRVLLRLYQGDPARAAREAALARSLRARGVPLPRLLHAAGPDPRIGHHPSLPWAVFDWIEGTSLDQAARDCDGDVLAALGAAVGGAAAAIHAVTFPRHGFLDAALDVAAPVDFDARALCGFLRTRLLDGSGGTRLGRRLTRRLLEVAKREAGRLADWPHPPCLVHGDFNPTNILVAARPEGWDVAAVLDWEWAISGPPALDFGNLLRPALGMRPDFVAGLARGYRAAGGALPPDWRAIARFADLFAWADILGRPAIDPAVLADARRVVRTTLRLGA